MIYERLKIIFFKALACLHSNLYLQEMLLVGQKMDFSFKLLDGQFEKNT